jgi:hypothetical protein
LQNIIFDDWVNYPVIHNLIANHEKSPFTNVNFVILKGIKYYSTNDYLMPLSNEIDKFGVHKMVDFKELAPRVENRAGSTAFSDRSKRYVSFFTVLSFVQNT